MSRATPVILWELRTLWKNSEAKQQITKHRWIRWILKHKAFIWNDISNWFPTKAPSPQHQQTDTHTQNITLEILFVFRERVSSRYSILKDYVHIFDLTLTSEAGRCSLSIDHCQREECAGELVSAFKLLLYAQYQPQGNQSRAASIVVLSLTAKIRSINFQTAFLFPPHPGRKDLKGEVGFCSIEYSCENFLSVFKLLLFRGIDTSTDLCKCD